MGTTRVSAAAVVGALVVQLAAPSTWHSASLAVFASGVAVGIPHGAVDHLVPAWFRIGTTAVGRVAVLSGYVAAAAGAFLFALWAPSAALALFLAASVMHFGRGETAVSALRRPSHAPPRQVDRICVVAYGAVTTLLPLARWPRVVRPFVQQLAPGAERLLTPTTCLTTMALTGGVVVLAGVALARTARFLDIAELALLTALFALLPPLAAFGIYFGAWHSPRHIGRLVCTDPANHALLAAGRLPAVLWRFTRQAAAPTAAGFLALTALLYASQTHRDAFVPVGIAFLAALTAPHLVVVALLDRHAAAPVDAFPIRPEHGDL
ncbi:Brp/Blh family beta-carotene 15,15'-dioxygenase [Streptomyces beigongshangae]|uniref:Brp/Blh family beta-carotene 15,15'-dioxygenase n=1 Tax=Streptomyces beigongshangae TaxID=2841597 RepID=UPI001C84D7FD|nr:Brp/Blh family beta-carotene 15,15'-dioxygenase [Streptomyces sp. REN17]